ncbi:Uncharacterised protein [Candidatus Ornithobacterium hominis]|uniref:Uncharacterized protein n=1 Tax=Candidatus Ornithobacterium hominis TaxID=2497989 RepID=A0A383TXH1_9FLAO|nr:Uncharacterised protein [Candidatus Ornithobacterium hominis]
MFKTIINNLKDKLAVHYELKRKAYSQNYKKILHLFVYQLIKQTSENFFLFTEEIRMKNGKKIQRF